MLDNCWIITYLRLFALFMPGLLSIELQRGSVDGADIGSGSA